MCQSRHLLGGQSLGRIDEACCKVNSTRKVRCKTFGRPLLTELSVTDPGRSLRTRQYVGIHHMSAGVIVFSDDKVLLGRETGGWSAFGGGRAEGETPWDTAIRELQEESVGILTSEDAHRCCEGHLLSTTPRGYSFTLFFLRIDRKIDLQSFTAKRNQSNTEAEREKTELSWFRIDEVQTHMLRPGFQKDWSMIKSQLRHLLSGQLHTADQCAAPSTHLPPTYPCTPRDESSRLSSAPREGLDRPPALRSRGSFARRHRKEHIV
jgi:8-oxo-dGTP pyrophosphatase MutT (NUDIX family)